jgi:inosine-uridine nucleoside N-ribohydrolase
MYVIKPSLFHIKKAAIRVVTQGLAIGQTIASQKLNTQSDVWQVNKFNAYADQVDSEGAKALLLSRLAAVKFVN